MTNQLKSIKFIIIKYFLKENREKERRERKKQKEKERIARLKQEGKFMTKEQKEAKQRTLLQLQAMGAKIPFAAADQNVEEAPEAAPTQTATSKPKYERIRKKQVQATNQTAEEKAAADLENKQAQKDGVKDSWDSSSDEEEEVKEAWDADSEDEKKKAAKKAAKAAAAAAAATQAAANNDVKKQSEGEETEEEEEESESESEHESEAEESDHENRDLPPMERVKLRLQVIV